VFAICIEASHSKGMGHLFRMLNFSKFLKTKNEDFIFIINNNDKIKDILKSHDIAFEILNLKDSERNWEQDIIRKYNIIYWVNDRLETNKQHAFNIKESNIKLITLDDFGSGAGLSDISIYGLSINQGCFQGKKILQGVDFLILNKEIDRYKKKRIDVKKILVTLGGSDTYGVTIKILRLLKKYHIGATIHIGPSFMHKEELKKELTKDYKVVTFTPSLIKEFAKYDLAITGGGITPFEANASGLPCLIIANELFEIENGFFLERMKSSRFLGYYKSIDETIFSDLNILDINLMSQNGMQILNTRAVEKIYKNIKKE
jgi:spore coat polysaccharide biosynthesis predicted glycosyltransferase SpsG